MATKVYRYFNNGYNRGGQSKGIYKGRLWKWKFTCSACLNEGETKELCDYIETFINNILEKKEKEGVSYL